jgi:hypothetical protein
MKLFAFGLGFSAQELASRFAARGWQIAGTARDEGNLAKARAQGYQMARFAGEPGNRDVTRLLQGTTHLVHSIPPGHDGDPVLAHYRDQIATIGTLEWIGYLSTVGVYGDQEGRWVDETTPPKPNSDRTEARVEAEEAWLQFGEETGIPTHVFRLAGIYGPGRSAFDKLIAGTARRIMKDGQVFSRIHVADIASVLEASIARAPSTMSPMMSPRRPRLSWSMPHSCSVCRPRPKSTSPKRTSRPWCAASMKGAGASQMAASSRSSA